MHNPTEVRNTAPCPKCGAAIGQPCIYRGKGSQRMRRRGSNHQVRKDLATEIDRANKKANRKRRTDFEVIDARDRSWMDRAFEETMRS